MALDPGTGRGPDEVLRALGTGGNGGSLKDLIQAGLWMQVEERAD